MEKNITPVTEKSPNTQHNNLSKRKLRILSIIAVILISVISISILAVFLIQRNSQNQSSLAQNSQEPDIVMPRVAFAEMKVDSPNVTPNVPAYNLGDNYSNIVNFNRFTFTDEALNQLKTNQFVVETPSKTSGGVEFFGVYGNNEGYQIPSFITSDSVLHDYHLIFDDTLKTLETTVFSDKLTSTVTSILDLSKKQYTYFSSVKNTELTQAAERNVAYFTVDLKLLGVDVTSEDYVKDVVDQEIALINAAQESLTPDPIINLFNTDPQKQFIEDFTQYIPRGHYTGSDKLKEYFKAMMYLGRMTFRQTNDSENMSALLIVQAINSNTDTLKSWSDVYDSIGFIIGNADDLGIYEYSKIATDTFGTLANESIADSKLQTKFIEQIKKLAPPKIDSIPVYTSSTSDTQDQTKGFRFMGQRYTIDANVFQDLIYPAVDKNSKGESRYLPSSLDVLSAMGSEKAQNILNQTGVEDFKDYITNMSKLKTTISAFTLEDWTSNLYSGWLYMIKPLLTAITGSYPDFMKNDNWNLKEMNSYQGSWTELKHDTILYTKQSNSGLGSGGDGVPIDLDYRGYVEPQIDIYARLEGLATAMLDGLNSRNLLSGQSVTFEETDSDCTPYGDPNSCVVKTTFDPQTVKDNISNIKTIATTLKNISVKELENTALTDDENNFIKKYGNNLRTTWKSTLHKDELSESDFMANLQKNPAMLVADVSTDGNSGTVLEEGTGKIMDIYIIIPVPGGDGNYLRIAKGAVWSQYEFTQPIAQRLTDQQWQDKVRNNDVPAMSSWKNDFMVSKVSTKFAVVPLSYKTAIDSGDETLDIVKGNCVNNGGVFQECGNACPENQKSCPRTCEQLCTFYRSTP